MTLNSLYRKALEKLQVAAAGEGIGPDDQALLASKYTDLYGLMRGLKLVSWGPNESIPDEASIPVINMLACAVASEFGKDARNYMAEGSVGLPIPSLAESQIRALLANEYVSAPAQSEYF